MADANDVQIELINNGDLWTLYEGAPFATRTGSMRFGVLKLAWDLLRFQAVNKFAGPLSFGSLFGLRDAVTRSLYTTERNYLILQRIAKKLDIDISDIPG